MDMNSTNGVAVNRRKVTTTDLKDGDLIKAGATVIRVSLQETEPEASDTLVASEPPRLPMSFEHAAVDVTRSLAQPLQPPTITAPSPEAEGAVPPREPLPIPGYQIVRELGRGGMGIVYLASRKLDGELVALKTIEPAVGGTPAQIERFLREARILGQLDHSHIVSFREMGQAGDLFYFVMDYVPGSDVAALQKKIRGPLPIPRAVDLTCQMLSALEYAHEKGFVHRDIKPANMLVERKDGKDVVRVSDFGLARVYQTSPLSGLTLEGSPGGTMAFAAPEQITNFRTAKPPADQYAAAATLYKLLTNRYVFDLPSHFEQQILMILQDEPVPIRTRRPEIPEGLAAIVHRSLAKDPKDRFPGVRAMRAALAKFGRKP
jgi:serine/threonine-protein kinase